MAMTTCQECGKDVSDKANACPACGAPMQGLGAHKGPPHDCSYCGGKIKKLREFQNQGSGCIIIILGICLAPFLIGIPIILYGLHMQGKCQYWWLCKKCGQKMPRKRGLLGLS